MDVKNSRLNKANIEITEWLIARLQLLDLNLFTPALVATTSHVATTEHIDISVLVFLSIAAGLPRLVELWRESKQLARRALINLAALTTVAATTLQLLIITT